MSRASFYARAARLPGTLLAGGIVGVVSFFLYWLTCFRTITWWDSADYSTAAACLGITAPPGSLVAVVAGWLVCRLVPLGTEAFALNLLAALLAAGTTTIIVVATLSISGAENNEKSAYRPHIWAWLVGGSIVGGLTLSTSETLWLHATKFTPYIFTACLTAILLWQLIQWWQEADELGAGWRLVLIMFLLGLDFSIHRTNSLLAPGVLVWILLRRPRVLAQARSWGFGVAALAAGLAVHLLLIPMAARQPYMNFNHPSSLSAFWDYISLKQFGGGWLLGLLPRKAPFWSYQVVDYLRVFAANFVDICGSRRDARSASGGAGDGRSRFSLAEFQTVVSRIAQPVRAGKSGSHRLFQYTSGIFPTV